MKGYKFIYFLASIEVGILICLAKTNTGELYSWNTLGCIILTFFFIDILTSGIKQHLNS